jgi:Calx-beta domain
VLDIDPGIDSPALTDSISVKNVEAALPPMNWTGIKSEPSHHRAIQKQFVGRSLFLKETEKRLGAKWPLNQRGTSLMQSGKSHYLSSYTRTFIASLVLILSVANAWSLPDPDYEIPWWSVDDGTPTKLSSGLYTLSASIGQADACLLSYGDGTISRSIRGGFQQDFRGNSLQFAKKTISVSESDEWACVEVCLDYPCSTFVDVNYATSNDSAIDGEDYTAVSGTLRFLPGERSKTIAVPISSNEDSVVSESFKMTLSSLNTSESVSFGFPTEAVVSIMEGALIKVVGAPVEFMAHSVSPGPSETQGVWICNKGDAPLEFTGDGYTISGTNAGDFLYSFIGSSEGLAPHEVDFVGFEASSPSTDDIPVGGYRYLPILFNPTSPGWRAAQLDITTNAVNDSSYTVDLTGFGTDSNPTYTNDSYFDLRQKNEGLVLTNEVNTNLYTSDSVQMSSEWEKETGLMLRNTNKESTDFNYSYAELDRVVPLDSEEMMLTKVTYHSNFINAPNNRNLPVQRLTLRDGINVVQRDENWNSHNLMDNLWQSLATPWSTSTYYTTYPDPQDERLPLDISFDSWGQSSTPCYNVIVNYDDVLLEQVKESDYFGNASSIYSADFSAQATNYWSYEAVVDPDSELDYDNTNEGLSIKRDQNAGTVDGTCWGAWKKTITSVDPEKTYKIVAKIAKRDEVDNPPCFRIRATTVSQDASLSKMLEINPKIYNGWDNFVPETVANGGTEYTIYWKTPHVETTGTSTVDQLTLCFDVIFEQLIGTGQVQDEDGEVILQSIDVYEVAGFSYSFSGDSQYNSATTNIFPISTDTGTLSYPLLTADRWLTSSEETSKGINSYLFQISENDTFTSIIQEIKVPVALLNSNDTYIHAFLSDQKPTSLAGCQVSSFTVTGDAFSIVRGNYSNSENLTFEPDPAGIYLKPEVNIDFPSELSTNSSIISWFDLQVLTDDFGGSTREGTVISQEFSGLPEEPEPYITPGISSHLLNLVNMGPLSDYAVGFSLALTTPNGSIINGYCKAVPLDSSIAGLEQTNEPENGGWASTSFTNVEIPTEAVGTESLALTTSSSAGEGYLEEDLITSGIETEKLYRLRYKVRAMGTDQTDVPTMKYYGSLQAITGPDSDNEVSVRVSSDDISQSWYMDDGSTASSSRSNAAPIIGQGVMEYDVYVSAASSRTSDHLEGGWGIEVEADASRTTSVAMTLDDVEISEIDPDNMIWMKTAEWKFHSNPYVSGWEKTATATDNYSLQYDRDFPDTEADTSGIKDRLKIQVETGFSGTAGFTLENILRRPETDTQGLHPGVYTQDGQERCMHSYDYRNRILRLDLTLSSNVDGDEIPTVCVSMKSNGFENLYELTALYEGSGYVTAGDEKVVSFYFHPQHYLADLDSDTTASKRLDFSLVATGLGSGSSPQIINLENLVIHEALISDLPQGENYLNPAEKTVFNTTASSNWWDDDYELWPPVSQFRLTPDVPKYIIKPVTGLPDGSNEYSTVDHGIIYNANDEKWHLYGILNVLDGFTVSSNIPGTSGNIYYNGLGYCSFSEMFPGTSGLSQTDDGWYIFNLSQATVFTTVDDNYHSDYVWTDYKSGMWMRGPWAPTLIEDPIHGFRMLCTEHSFKETSLDGVFATAGNTSLTSSNLTDVSSWKYDDSGDYLSSCLVATNRRNYVQRHEITEAIYNPDGTITPNKVFVDGYGMNATPRDIQLPRCIQNNDENGYQAVWVGYNEVKNGEGKYELLTDNSEHKTASSIMTKYVSSLDELKVPQDELDFQRTVKEYEVLGLINPDSGRLDSQHESPFLVYDHSNDTYYLTATKNGNQHPNMGRVYGDTLNDFLFLDSDGIKVGDMFTQNIGSDSYQMESSLLAPLAPFADETKNLHDPVDFVIYEVTGGVTWQVGEMEFVPQMEIIVADNGDDTLTPPVLPRLVKINLMTGDREVLYTFGATAILEDLDIATSYLSKVSVEDEYEIQIYVLCHGVVANFPDEDRIVCLGNLTGTAAKINSKTITKNTTSSVSELYSYDLNSIDVSKIYVSNRYSKDSKKYLYFIGAVTQDNTTIQGIYGGDFRLFHAAMPVVNSLVTTVNTSSGYRILIKQDSPSDPDFFDVYEEFSEEDKDDDNIITKTLLFGMDSASGMTLHRLANFEHNSGSVTLYSSVSLSLVFDESDHSPSLSAMGTPKHIVSVINKTYQPDYHLQDDSDRTILVEGEYAMYLLKYDEVDSKYKPDPHKRNLSMI